MEPFELSNNLISIGSKSVGVGCIAVGVGGFALSIFDMIPGDEPIGIGWFLAWGLVGLALLGFSSTIPKIIGGLVG